MYASNLSKQTLPLSPSLSSLSLTRPRVARKAALAAVVEKVTLLLIQLTFHDPAAVVDTGPAHPGDMGTSSLRLLLPSSLF